MVLARVMLTFSAGVASPEQWPRAHCRHMAEGQAAAYSHLRQSPGYSLTLGSGSGHTGLPPPAYGAGDRPRCECDGGSSAGFLSICSHCADDVQAGPGPTPILLRTQPSGRAGSPSAHELLVSVAFSVSTALPYPIPPRGMRCGRTEGTLPSVGVPPLDPAVLRTTSSRTPLQRLTHTPHPVPTGT